MLECAVCFVQSNNDLFIKKCNICSFNICFHCLKIGKPIIDSYIYSNYYEFIFCSLPCAYIDLFKLCKDRYNFFNEGEMWYSRGIVNRHQTHLYKNIYTIQLRKILVDWFIKDIGKLIDDYCEIDD